MNVYLDTCVLPVRRELRRGHLGLLGALARSDRLRLFAPSLVRDEFANLRRQRAEDALGKLREGYRAAFDHLGITESYMPSVEEVVGPLVSELESLVSVIPVHPEDAVEALRREAGRIRPAREGKGARDCAIWLTVVRHHASEKDPGVLLTTNTTDFAAETDRGQPHERLVEDLAETARRFAFKFAPSAFLEEIAPRVEESIDLVQALDGDAQARTDLAAGLHDLRSGSVASPAPFGTASANVSSATVEAVHKIEDGVSLLRAKIVARLDHPETEPIDAIVWLESTPTGLTFLEAQRSRA